MTKIKKDNNAKDFELSEKLLSLMGVNAKLELNTKEDGLMVNIDAGEESGLLIGNRGRTLQSLQHILSMMINKDKKAWRRITVDIASWREKEEERLAELAKQTAERVRTSGTPQNLYNLSSEQRRIVHMTLSEEKDILTESQGEGKDRCLVVTSKNVENIH